MAKRIYSDAEKAAALIALDANDGDLDKTSIQTGIPKTTIADWNTGRRPVGAHIQQMRIEKRTSQLEDLEAFLVAARARLMALLPDATFPQVATAYGIIFDKTRVLQGMPTEITQDVTLSDDERTAALADLVKLARERKKTET